MRKLTRKILLKISFYVFKDQILEILYPDDCIITFGNGPLTVSCSFNEDDSESCIFPCPYGQIESRCQMRG